MSNYAEDADGICSRCGMLHNLSPECIGMPKMIELTPKRVDALRDAIRAVTANLDSDRACHVNAILQEMLRP